MVHLHHSAAVHIPLALAVLFPLIHILFLILFKVQFLPRRAWLLTWLLGLVQWSASVLAYLTGQRDLALSSAAVELLTEHQSSAKYFILVWTAIVCVLPLAFWLKRFGWAMVFHIVLLALLAAQLLLAVHLGHIGGQLVFGS